MYGLHPRAYTGHTKSSTVYEAMLGRPKPGNVFVLIFFITFMSMYQSQWNLAARSTLFTISLLGDNISQLE